MSAHLHRVLLLTAVTGELMKRAQARDAEKTAQASKIGPLAKTAAEALAKHDRIKPDQIEKVAAGLQSHEGALALLPELARHRTDRELGQPAGKEKAGSASPQQRRSASDSPATNFDDTEHGRRFSQSMLG